MLGEREAEMENKSVIDNEDQFKRFTDIHLLCILKKCSEKMKKIII